MARKVLDRGDVILYNGEKRTIEKTGRTKIHLEGGMVVDISKENIKIIEDN